MKYTKGKWVDVKQTYVKPFTEDLVLFDAKRFVKEIQPYVLKLEKEHTEMHEALEYAYEILASVEIKYPTRDSAIGQFKMAGIRSLLKELQS